MDTTNKIQVNSDTQIMDWAKPYYNVSPNTATNQVQLKSPQEVITVDSLKQVPDLKLPKAPVQNNVVASEIVSTTQPSIQQAQQDFNQIQQVTGTQAKDAQDALQALALNVFGQKAQAQGNQVNIENQLGIQEQQKALSQINSEMATEQLGLRNEQEKLRQSFGSEAQKAISQNTLNDTYGRRLADLAIRQSAANQNITAIQTNAERQTKLLTAPLDTKIQYLSTFAKDNVDFLNNEQKTKVAFLTNNLENQKKDIQALQSAKTQMIMEIANNGGGTNTALIKQIQDAKTAGDVTSLGASSGYIGKLDRSLKQAQLTNIYSEINARNKASKEKALANQQDQQVIPGNKPIGKPDTKLAGFATRAEEAAKIAYDIELGDKGKGLTNKVFTLRGTRDFVKPDEYKNYDQAQENFIGSVLRPESGASISLDEFEKAKNIYFAKPGDSDSVVLQKQRARVDAVNSLIAQGGTAFDGTFQSLPQTYREASFDAINPFAESLAENQGSTSSIYNEQSGYTIPK